MATPVSVKPNKELVEYLVVKSTTMKLRQRLGPVFEIVRTLENTSTDVNERKQITPIVGVAVDEI